MVKFKFGKGSMMVELVPINRKVRDASSMAILSTFNSCGFS